MTMQLEQQVCSLESAKKLRELGVRQESLFYWHLTVYEDWRVLMGRNEMWEEEYTVSAFTVAELGEFLPLFVEQDKKKFKLYLAKNEYGEWFVEYHEWSLKQLDNYELLVQRHADTESEARAKMLIYLIENKLIPIPNDPPRE